MAHLDLHLLYELRLFHGSIVTVTVGFISSILLYFFNWVALYARLNTQHKASSYNKKKKKMKSKVENYLERTQI